VDEESQLIIKVTLVELVHHVHEVDDDDQRKDARDDNPGVARDHKLRG
jgi:hypothetical protein